MDGAPTVEGAAAEEVEDSGNEPPPAATPLDSRPEDSLMNETPIVIEGPVATLLSRRPAVAEGLR